MERRVKYGKNKRKRKEIKLVRQKTKAKIKAGGKIRKGLAGGV